MDQVESEKVKIQKIQEHSVATLDNVQRIEKEAGRTLAAAQRMKTDAEALTE